MHAPQVRKHWEIFVLTLVVVLMIPLVALADLSKTTTDDNGSAFYDSSQNEFTVNDLGCDGDHPYVNWAFNDDGATPSSYSTYTMSEGCGNSEKFVVFPSDSQVVFRVCIYDTFGSDNCSTWGSTNA